MAGIDTKLEIVIAGRVLIRIVPYDVAIATDPVNSPTIAT